MKIALVGYSNGGKTTLFELLTGVKADPAHAHTGQRAMAQLHDPRLEKLAAIYHSKKATPAAVEVDDTPSLARGAGSDNAHRLAALREADGLALVVGAFAGADAAADQARFDDELLLADLELVSAAIHRLKLAAAKPRPDRDAQLEHVALLEPIEQALSQGTPLWQIKLTEEQKLAIRAFALLTEKPRLVIVNVAEEAMGGDAVHRRDGSPAGRRQGNDGERRHAHADSPPPPVSHSLAVCLKLQRELADLSPEEQTQFMKDLGVAGLARDPILAALLETLVRIVFFTANQREVRAWLLPHGADAVTAAGLVHTDMARGFIRAEIISADALLQATSEREAKARGLFHVEGRDYIVQNGDVVLVRFSV